jgi:hypothetical protein
MNNAVRKYENMRESGHNDHTQEIAQYLAYYFKTVWQKAGLNWTSDNEAEIQTLAEYITEH